MSTGQTLDPIPFKLHPQISGTCRGVKNLGKFADFRIL
jgi:hypothetical protein